MTKEKEKELQNDERSEKTGGDEEAKPEEKPEEMEERGEAKKSKTEQLREELEEAKAEAAENYDRWIRLAAEFENYKKRISREFETLIRLANENLMTQLIPVLDNFERALNHPGDESNFDSFRKGIEMIFGQLEEALKKEGLEPIESVGKPFDPNLHEAIMQMESDEHDSEIVLEEIERGYKLNDRVIRPAKVIVSK